MIFNDLIIELAAVDISLRKNTLYDFLILAAFQTRRVFRVLRTDHQERRNTVFLHQTFDSFEVLAVADAYWSWVHKDTRSLNFFNFIALLLNWHEPMNDAESSLSGHFDSHRGLSDCIHG